MASTKIVSLLIRTLAKPISTSIKENAKSHARFREMTISIAQRMHRIDMRLRAGVLVGSTPKHIRPLNDAKAIDQGANFLAEGFLFAVAALLIIGETVRGRVKTANRKETVDEKLEELAAQLQQFEQMMNDRQQHSEERIQRLTDQMDNLVDIGRRGGWISRALENGGSSVPPALEAAPTSPAQDSEAASSASLSTSESQASQSASK